MLKHRIISALVSLMLVLVILTGCSNIKFAMPLSSNKFAELKNKSITVGMAEIIMAEQKYSYEHFFDKQVWSKEMQGMTMEEYVIDSVKDMIRSLMYLNEMADQMEIFLTEDESLRVRAAAEKYGKSFAEPLSEETVEDVENVYRMIMLAEKAFYAITQDVEEEVSADDARIISVQYIFISTMEKDENGNIVSVVPSVKNNKRKQMEKILKEIQDGGDFATIALRDSDDAKYVLEFGRGQYDKAFENAAFELEMGEASGIVETDYGYYIIKCINDNVESNIESRKAEIVLLRRKEIFEEYYLEHSKGLNIRFNDKYLNRFDFENIRTGNGMLYEIYKEGAIK